MCPDGTRNDKQASALRNLDWAVLLGREDPAHLQFLAALVADVSDAVGAHPETGPLTRATSPWTTLRMSAPARVLRNL